MPFTKNIWKKTRNKLMHNFGKLERNPWRGKPWEDLKTSENIDIEGLDLTCCGRLFQVWAVAQGRPDRRWWTVV